MNLISGNIFIPH